MIAEPGVLDFQPAVVGCRSEHRERTAFALAQRLEIGEARLRDRHDITFLGFVTPNLRRGHAWLFRRNVAQIDMAATTGSMHQFRQCIGQSTRTHVVDRQDRIGFSERPAAVDDFLRTALDLGVAALHGIEIEISDVGPGIHARCRAAPHADQHAGAANLHQQRARGHPGLQRLQGRDRADPAGQHDRLVITAYFAIDRLLESPEVTAQIRAAELVVERSRADRSVQHDLQRGCDTVRLADCGLLPRLFKTGNAQMGNGKPRQSGLGFRAAAGRALVADLPAGSGRRASKGRDRRRVIVRFHLHQDVRQLGGVAVDSGRVRIEALDLGALNDRSIVRVRHHRSFGMRRMRMPDHAEQRFWLLLAVDYPLGVENLVPAVFGISLGKHHQFDVGRIACHAPEILH